MYQAIENYLLTGKLEREDLNTESFAQEGLLDNSYSAQFRKSPEMQKAEQLYTMSKKIYNAGGKEKAQIYMKQALKLYEDVLKKAKQAGGMAMVEREVGMDAFHKDKRKMEVSTSKQFGYLQKNIEERILSCKAYLMKWENVERTEEVEELKKQLEKDLADQRAIEKANKKR